LPSAKEKSGQRGCLLSGKNTLGKNVSEKKLGKQENLPSLFLLSIFHADFPGTGSSSMLGSCIELGQGNPVREGINFGPQ
jgi:hypothetical protein